MIFDGISSTGPQNATRELQKDAAQNWPRELPKHINEILNKQREPRNA